MELRKAEKQKAKLRIGLSGSSGSGKTYSALLMAFGITSDWAKIALIDTENGSGDLYSDFGEYNIITLDSPYSPERYIEAIKTCEKAEMEVIIIDSISHEWEGEGGCLQIVDQLGGRYTDWGKVTPRHKAFIDAIVQSKSHIITTVRRKQDHVISTDDKGKMKVQKAGLKEITREGFEYELTINFEITTPNHLTTASKDRTNIFANRPDFVITSDTGKELIQWANSGVEKKLNEVKIENTRDTLINSCVHIASEKGYDRDKLDKLIEERYTEARKKNPNFLLYKTLNNLPESHLIKLEEYLQTIPAIQEQTKERELTKPSNVQPLPEKKNEKPQRQWIKADYVHEVSRLRLEKNLVVDVGTYKFDAQTLDDLPVKDLKLIIKQIEENEITKDGVIKSVEKEKIKAGINNFEVELRKQILTLLDECGCTLVEIANVENINLLAIDDLQKLKRTLQGLKEEQKKEKEDLTEYYTEIVKLAREKNVDVEEFCKELFKQEKVDSNKLTKKQLKTIIEELRKE